MDYVSLRTQSTFSICQAFGMPDQIVRKAKELGHKAICLAENDNTSSHPKLEKACKEHGIKPIYGINLNVVENHADKDRYKDNLLVIAKNSQGYSNLLELANVAFKPDHFYYVPTVEYRELYSLQEGLIVLTGNSLTGDIDKAEERLQELKDNIDHLYVEVDVSKDQMGTRQAMMLARMHKVPMVATNDTQFIEDGQDEIVYFLTSIKSKGKRGGRRPSIRSKLATGEEMLDWGASEQAIQNSVEIANLVEEFELPKAEELKFKGATDPYEELVQQCRNGWKERNITRDKWDTYLPRLKRELNLIKDKGYIDYFLVVSDLIRWAKEQGILVGPARGSAAGSLVSYLIGITEVDPLKWDLLFERFIDVSRHDPPDIDIDFQDDRRDEVKEYLQEKYGVERVSNIAGYSLLKPKSLLDDMGRVYKIPKAKIEKAKNLLKENGGGMTLQEVFEHMFPEHSIIMKAEGMIRHLTIHAAGAVVSSEELAKFTVIGRGGLMLDKRDTEYLGLMKIDLLSLTTLTILSNILKAIGKTPEWMYKEIPLDDPATYAAFKGEYFQGIFQYEGGATKRVCQQVEPENFHELVDINALSRPGPLSSGATEAYIKRQKIDLHPVVTKHTARSRGQILFQEQTMKVLREAGNLDWGDVTAVRKLITKNEGAELLEPIHQRFLDNFEDKEMAQKIWNMIGEAGAYGFNVAHSTSYTFLGYYCMYLKVHYPLEFYWGNLVVEPDNEAMLMEYIQRGGKVYGVKFGKSGASWTLDKDGIRAGYLTLHGIGPKSAEKLVAGQIPKGKAKKVLEEAGAFDESDEEVDYLGIHEVADELTKVFGRERIQDIRPGEYVRIGGKVTKIQFKDLRKVVEGQGRNYEQEVKDPHLNKYVHMELTDDSGMINVTVNRYKYAVGYIQQEVDKIKEGTIVWVTGKYSEEYRKVYANKIGIV